MAEVRTAEVRLEELRLKEVGPAEVCMAKVCSGEACLEEVRLAQVGLNISILMPPPIPGMYSSDKKTSMFSFAMVHSPSLFYPKFVITPVF